MSQASENHAFKSHAIHNQPLSPTLSSWVKEFFDETYLELSSSVFKKDQAEIVLNHVKSVNPTNPCLTFFDQCCGSGDLSLQLAQLGLTGVAVDQSAQYIKKAQHRLNEHGLDHQVEFICKDAGQFVPFPQDISISWHTSLGYSGKEGAYSLLRNLVASTKKGGTIVLDIRHLSHYQQEPTHKEEHIVFKGQNALLVKEGVWEGQTLKQKWWIKQGEDVLWHQEETSCYHLSEEEIILFAKHNNLDLFVDQSIPSRMLVLLNKK